MYNYHNITIIYKIATLILYFLFNVISYINNYVINHMIYNFHKYLICYSLNYNLTIGIA